MTRSIHRLGIFVTTALVAATLAASPAHAKPTWQPVTNLFADLSATGGSAQTPAVAVDSDGNATALWSRYDGTKSVVQASTRPAGSTWSAPQDLATGWSIYQPQLTVDPVGNATAVWRRSDGASSVVQAATRPTGGTWTTAVDLSVDLTVDLSQKTDAPNVAVDAVGNATAIWSHYEANKYIVQTATRPADGTWTTPVDLSVLGQSARTPQIAIDPAGNATAIWQRHEGASSWVVTTATRPAGGTWRPPVDLSDPSSWIDGPRVAVDPTGNATAVWGHFNGANYVIRAATRPTSGTWTAPGDLSAKGQDAPGGPQIGIDAHGNTTVIWERHDGSNSIVVAATRAAGGTWTAPIDLSDPGRDAFDSQIAVDPVGHATATWSRSNGANRVVQAATRPTAGIWTAPIDLSNPGGDAWNPQIAVDPAGNATTAWSRHDGTTFIVQARGLDAAGPVVTALVAPTSGSTGQTLSYSVTAHDVWSTVKSVVWDFGDGTTATGNSVTHVQAKDRARPVKVTLTDAVGNTTTCNPTCTSSTRSAPVITRAKIKPAKIRAHGSHAKAKKKAKVSLVLTTAAKVTLAFTKKSAGKKRVGKKIRLTRHLKAGKNTFKVRARLARGKILRPGRYKITITAKSTAGTSRAKKLGLRVVR